MEDILKDFKENWFLDETNTGIAKEHYKEEGFKQTILFKVVRKELDEKYFEESLNAIKPLLNNENLVVCHTPIVGYQTNSYAVDDITDIETIKTSIKNGFIVLLYAPVVVDNELKYKTKIILKLNNNVDLQTEINKSSARLIKKGVEFGADSIDVDEQMLEILKKLKYFHLKDNDERKHVGTLAGRYFIYLKEKTPKNQIIIYNENSPHREIITVI
jgi:hypothetical protein